MSIQKFLRETPGHARLLGLFLGLLLLVPLIAFSIVLVNGPDIREDAFGDLQALAKVKADQIENWLGERRSNLEFLADSKEFAQYAQRLRLTGDAESRALVVQHLKTYLKSEYHDAALLLNAAGQVLASAGTPTDLQSPTLQPLLDSAWRSGRIEQGDLFRDASGQVYLDFVLPLPGTSGGQPMAVVLRAPVERFLFPLIQTLPTTSQSAETLLVRRDGDHVLFLNELRHHKDSALSLRLPLQPSLPASVAVQSGKAQIHDGVDYRGVAVLAASHPVAGTPWQVIAKIDRQEVMAPLRSLIAWVIYPPWPMSFSSSSAERRAATSWPESREVKPAG